MALHQRAVGLDRPLDISLLFRLLRLREKLLRVAAHFLLARGLILRLFAGLKDDGAGGGPRQSAARSGAGKISMRKEIFHRVAQGSYLTRPVKLARANKWPLRTARRGGPRQLSTRLGCDYSAKGPLNLTAQQKIRLGACAWSFEEWRGSFYPADLPPARWLEFYSHYFPAVEIDSTFYSAPAEATVRRWVEHTPAAFRFACKLPREITHARRLRDCGAELAAFLRAHRTARAEASGHPDSIASLLRAEGWPAGVAGIPGTTPARFPLCDRVSPSRLASSANHSPSGETPRLLGLGRHQPAERTQSRARSNSCRARPISFICAFSAITPRNTIATAGAFIVTANFFGNAKPRSKAGRSRSSGIWPTRGASGLS